MKLNVIPIVAISAVAWLTAANEVYGQHKGNNDGVNYPTRPIRLIDPFPPGGGTWFIGRLVGEKLSESLGQPIVHDNRAGAGGSVGSGLAARATADGHTLLLATSSSIAVNPLILKVPFDPIKDFVPVARIASTHLLMVVHPSLPARTVSEFLALLRSQKSSLNYASSGTGSLSHLTGELFNVTANVSMTHIPYKGGGPALTELIGGHVQLFFSNILTALPHAKSGRLRALAVAGPKRAQGAPDIPTVSESGLPGFEVLNWNGILAPAGTSPEIVAKLNRAINAALNLADVREKLISGGAEPVGGSPQQFGERIRADITKWAKVIKQSNIRTDYE